MHRHSYPASNLGQTSNPLERQMIRKIIVGSALALLGACSSGNGTDAETPASNELKLYGAKVANSLQNLPACDTTSQGQLFYAIQEASFYFCHESGYTAIDLQGKNGTDGTNGANGANGVNGTNGTDGKNCTVTGTGSVKTIVCGSTSTTVTDGVGCSIETTLAGYDLTCGSTTVTIANGLDGEDGEDGLDGKDGDDGVICSVVDNGQGQLTQTCGDTKVSWSKALCAGVAYEPTAYSCTDNALVLKADAKLCGTIYYSPAAFTCVDNALLPLAQSAFCGTLPYNPATSACLNGVVVAKENLQLCKNQTYDPDTHFCDDRDGKLYGLAQFGQATWMTQNLNYNVNDGAGSGCYGGISSNCDKFGRHYDWATARGVDRIYNSKYLNASNENVQGICPTGWHLPNSVEWKALQTNWTTGNGAQKFGYIAAGEYSSSWGSADDNMIMWSVEETGAAGANRYYVNTSKALLQSGYRKPYLHLVRCVRNAN